MLAKADSPLWLTMCRPPTDYLANKIPVNSVPSVVRKSKMQNTIRVGLEFSFRGETYSPSAVIDLDPIDGSAGAPNWHAILAAANGIDTYSYAYEVMEASALAFSEPTGLAVKYFADGHFDFDGFIRARGNDQTLRELQDIAKTALGIDNLDEEPAIKQALLQAYDLGKRS